MFMFGNKEEEATVELAETIIDTTKNISKLHYANEVMSSLLAKISTVVQDDVFSEAEMITTIRTLLEWYAMYQVGRFNADVAGTKLSEKSK